MYTCKAPPPAHPLPLPVHIPLRRRKRATALKRTREHAGAAVGPRRRAREQARRPRRSKELSSGSDHLMRAHVRQHVTHCPPLRGSRVAPTNDMAASPTAHRTSFNLRSVRYCSTGTSRPAAPPRCVAGTPTPPTRRGAAPTFRVHRRPRSEEPEKLPHRLPHALEKPKQRPCMHGRA